MKTACGKYAEAIEALMALEDIAQSNAEEGQLNILKISLFSNLAASNLKLDNHEGCRRCCNAALVFCNKPSLRLDELGVEEDLMQDVTLLQPVSPGHISLASKILFRRSKCQIEAGLLLEAEFDLKEALRHAGESSSSTEIRNELKIVSTKLSTSPAVLDKSAPNITSEEKTETRSPQQLWLELFRSHSSELDTSDLTVNGGPCFERKGLWSQTTCDASIYIPLLLLLELYEADLKETNTTQPLAINDKKFPIDVKFSTQDIRIFYNEVPIVSELLEYNIVPSDSIWMIEDLLDRTLSNSYCNNPSITLSNKGEATHLCLHVHKAAPLEWFPGCEWWDRVFRNDEAIDTLTCSVGSGKITDTPDNLIANIIILRCRIL